MEILQEGFWLSRKSWHCMQELDFAYVGYYTAAYYYESQLTTGSRIISRWTQGSAPFHHALLKIKITPNYPHLHTHSMITLIFLNVPRSKCRGCLPETNVVVWMVQTHIPNTLEKQAAEHCPQADHISHGNSTCSVLSGRESHTTSQA